jgi:hypothetical protein
VRRPGTLALVVVLGLAVAPARASVAKDEAKALWATVNVCDTAAYPDTIGIRASMPGTGSRRDELVMRFGAQYFDPVGKRWHNLSRGGDSGFVSVGSGRYEARQGGHLFTFAPPAGRRFQLRGVVAFEWRRDGRVVRRERLVTTEGHRSSAGADPQGYSAAVCVVG